MKSGWFVILLIALILTVVLYYHFKFSDRKAEVFSTPLQIETTRDDTAWNPPVLSSDTTDDAAENKKLRYGHELIAHTSLYLGPKGSVAHISNGMNCQNCHLDAGAKPWGNDLATVFANYPKYKSRSNTIQSIYDRINDCFQRSLNGHKLDTDSREMQSMYAYIRWLGKGVLKNTKPTSAGIPGLAFIQRPADAAQGQLVYISFCKSCHGERGEGLLINNKSAFLYPPLWGKNSFNDGAGLYRLGSMAGFVENNMPFQKASHDAPVLTTEQAWDVAAFINSRRRPHMSQIHDYPKTATKPFDFPFGPYMDGFKEKQHKYGPFAPIVAVRKKNG